MDKYSWKEVVVFFFSFLRTEGSLPHTFIFPILRDPFYVKDPMFKINKWPNFTFRLNILITQTINYKITCETIKDHP